MIQTTARTRLNILLAWLGGHGTILASQIVAEAGMVLEHDVKKADVHGTSQRGGSVISEGRWGRQVFSPVISPGEADFVIAFKKLETAHVGSYLRPDEIIVDRHALPPMTVSVGEASYSEDASLQKWLRLLSAQVYWVLGADIAEDLGHTKAADVVLLGAFFAILRYHPSLWLEVIWQCAPAKRLAHNEQIFLQNRAWIESHE